MQFTLIDRHRESVTAVDLAALVATLERALADGPPAVGLCGHAGFRVPDIRYLAPIVLEASGRTGRRVRLESALADARHSSDDRGCSPLRVHVEVPRPPGPTATLKNRLRLHRDDDPYVSQIPFAAPKQHAPGGLGHRHVLDAYRRLLSGDLYRWVSGRVMAAAQRTLERGGTTLLDFHASLRDVVLSEQLDGLAGLELVPTVATAYPADHCAHITRTHQEQSAVAVDLLRGADHAREVIAFFRHAEAGLPSARLPRWLFAPLEPGCYFCRGFGASREAARPASALAGSG